MVRILIAALLALAVAVPMASRADDRKTDTKKVEAKDLPLDKDFILRVSQANNNAENCLLVFEKMTSSDKVKQFAKEVKKDHDDLQRAVATAVKDKKLVIVNTPDRETVNTLNELRKKDKGEIDRAFLAHFVEGHERCLEMAKNQKAKGTDKAATDLAERMIPKLEDHIKKAKDLQKEFK